MGYIYFHRWDTVLRSNNLLRYQQGIPNPLLFTHYGKEKEHQGRRSSLLPQFLTQQMCTRCLPSVKLCTTMISTVPPPLSSSCQAHPHILTAPQLQIVRKQPILQEKVGLLFAYGNVPLTCMLILAENSITLTNFGKLVFNKFLPILLIWRS